MLEDSSEILLSETGIPALGTAALQEQKAKPGQRAAPTVVRPAISAAAANVHTALIPERASPSSAAAAGKAGADVIVVTKSGDSVDTEADAAGCGGGGDRLPPLQPASEEDLREESAAAAIAPVEVLASAASGEGASGPSPKILKFHVLLAKGEAAGGPEPGRKVQSELGLKTEAVLLGHDKQALLHRRVALRVVRVMSHGLVAEWNARHRCRKVRAGDFITQVNGECGAVLQLVQEITTSVSLELHFLRLP